MYYHVVYRPSITNTYFFASSDSEDVIHTEVLVFYRKNKIVLYNIIVSYADKVNCINKLLPSLEMCTM